MAWRATIKKDVLLSATLGISADIFCQCICEQKELRSVDTRRAFAIAIFSGSYIGVACNYIYSLYPRLSRIVLSSNVMQKMLPDCQIRAQGLVSTVTDNMLHVPMLYLPSYFISVGAMQGIPISESVNDMRESWWRTLGSCYMFWLPFMAFNFTRVPPEMRVKAVAGANFCWTVTLDYITQQHKSKD